MGEKEGGRKKERDGEGGEGGKAHVCVCVGGGGGKSEQKYREENKATSHIIHLSVAISLHPLVLRLILWVHGGWAPSSTAVSSR